MIFLVEIFYIIISLLLSSKQPLNRILQGEVFCNLP